MADPHPALLRTAAYLEREVAELVECVAEPCPQCAELRAENERLRAAIETVAALDGVDCGDSNCGFARAKTGMRTQGGCRCIEYGHPGVRSRLMRVVRALRAARGGR